MSAKKLSDSSLMMTKDFLVANKLGIHARPAAMFVKTANRFTCPHGRPTGWLLSNHEIEKKFKRKL